MDKVERVSATCPICHDGEEKRVGRGVPVGISVCPRCDYIALFLPPTIDRPKRSGAPDSS